MLFRFNKSFIFVERVIIYRPLPSPPTPGALCHVEEVLPTYIKRKYCPLFCLPAFYQRTELYYYYYEILFPLPTDTPTYPTRERDNDGTTTLSLAVGIQLCNNDQRCDHFHP